MAVDEKRVFTIPQVATGDGSDIEGLTVAFAEEENGTLRIEPGDADNTFPVRLTDLAEIVRRLTGGPIPDDTAACRGGVHPHSLNWDKPMTSRQAMRHCTTYGLIPAELYEADMKRLRERVAELESPTPAPTPRIVVARESCSSVVATYIDGRLSRSTSSPAIRIFEAAASIGPVATIEAWMVEPFTGNWPATLAALKRVEEVGT